MTEYLLWYDDLHVQGRAYSFPCTASGEIIDDQMTPTLYNNFDMVRRLVGVNYSMPYVVPKTKNIL